MSDSIFLTDGNGVLTGLVDTSYAGELIIPEYVAGERITAIGDSAFDKCSGLWSVTIPDSVTSIGNSAFNMCDGLTSINIPDGVTSIGSLAFNGCLLSSSITIPDSVTNIGFGAFQMCLYVTTVIIGNGVTTIGEIAFYGCDMITSVTIPDNVISIGNDAFGACYNLATVYVPDPNNLSTAVSSYDWTNTGSSGVTFLQDPAYIEYLIKAGTLTNLGNKIRVLSGSEATMTPVEMAEKLDDVQEKMDSALFLKNEEIPIPMPSNELWYSVTYGDGKFVSVAMGSNQAAYSSNGYQWYPSTMPSTDDWMSVTYGDGKFVAVSISGKVAYSTDGITWTDTTMPSTDNWYAITYGNGKFVALTNGSNRAAYSTDGITWTATTMPSIACWDSVIYGNGRFVAVSTYGGDLTTSMSAYSYDGITWTANAMSPNDRWSSVTYGGNSFVAVADSEIAAYSSNGYSWYTSTMPSLDSWMSVTYGDGKFVSVAMGSNQAAYSSNGYSWYTSTMPSTDGWISVTYGDGKFVAVSMSGKVAYSTDGITWCGSIIQTSIVNNSNEDVTESTIQTVMPLDTELATQDNLIAQIVAALEGKTAGGGVKAICFSIAGTYYPAEEGMTWEEWMNSEYNTSSLVIQSNDYISDGGDLVVGRTSNSLVHITDEIIANHNYVLTLY